LPIDRTEQRPGTRFKAGSGSQTAKLKSLAGYNLIWPEEAEEIGETEFMKLDDSLRTTKGSIRILFTLNTPPKNHWIIKALLRPRPRTSRSRLLHPETEERAERHLHSRHVPGQLAEHRSSDRCSVRQVQIGYGLDFGFDPDPACIIAIYWYNGGFILHEIIYQTELLNSHLNSTFKALPKAPIIADSAEPKSIAELQAAGLNVIPCEKGADSVHAGIKHVQSLPISYTTSSLNLDAQHQDYSWKITKDGETVGIEDPKKANHGMSAARYGLTMLAAAGAHYDPHQKERAAVEVSVTRRCLSGNQSR
jgi:phage terminase large subunit